MANKAANRFSRICRTSSPPGSAHGFDLTRTDGSDVGSARGEAEVESFSNTQTVTGESPVTPAGQQSELQYLLKVSCVFLLKTGSNCVGFSRSGNLMLPPGGGARGRTATEEGVDVGGGLFTHNGVHMGKDGGKSNPDRIQPPCSPVSQNHQNASLPLKINQKQNQVATTTWSRF